MLRGAAAALDQCRCQYLQVPVTCATLTSVYLHSKRCLTIKAAFHYSSKFSTRFTARFSTSSCGFATCFRHAFDFFVENLVANLLHQSRHVEIDAAGSQQVRWFVRVLDKWNVEKNRFEPANEPVEAGFSLRILLLVLIVT